MYALWILLLRPTMDEEYDVIVLGTGLKVRNGGLYVVKLCDEHVNPCTLFFLLLGVVDWSCTVGPTRYKSLAYLKGVL